MKFQTASAFEKHLKSSYPDHLSQLFLFVSPCDYEKRLWTESVAHLLRRKDPQLQIIRFSAQETAPGAIQDEARSSTLWGGMRMIVVEGIDKVKSLGDYLGLLSLFSPDVIMIFCASNSKSIVELYQKGKKEMIALDVSEEKPWDRERRLQEWIKDEAGKVGKQISTEATTELMRNLGTDLATLDQELKKLITYVGSKATLDKKDIKAICGSRDLATGWSLAEMLVWKHPIALQEKAGDLGFLFPFLGQIRYQLQLGAQIAELLGRKVTMPDLEQHFPSVRPQNLDKFIPVAARRGSAFFLKGLLRLYDFEFTAKSSSVDLGIAFDFFQAKLYEKTHSPS